MQQLAQETLKLFGKIDILVVASGINTPDRSMKRLTPEKYGNSLVDVNLNGAFYATHAFLPSMRNAGAGHLIYNLLESVGSWLMCPAPRIKRPSVGSSAWLTRFAWKRNKNGIRNVCDLSGPCEIPSYWKKGR